MRRRSRERKLDRRIAEAEQRVERLATHELYTWAEESLYVYGWCMEEHRKTDNPDTAMNMLDEAVLAAEVCRVIALELNKRYDVRRTTRGSTL